MKTKEDWAKEVLGGKKEIDGYISEIKLIKDRRSLIRALDNGTKDFLFVLVGYMGFPMKKNLKKKFFLRKVADIILTESA
jgi:hypothetical protein